MSGGFGEATKDQDNDELERTLQSKVIYNGKQFKPGTKNMDVVKF